MTDREEMIALYAIVLYESFITKGEVEYAEDPDGVHVVTEMDLDEEAVESTMSILRESDFGNIEMMHFLYYEDEPEDDEE